MINIMAQDKVFFNQKPVDIFLNSPCKHMLWYSLEVPQQDASYEYLQHMFIWRIKKNVFLIPSLIRSYET